MKSYFLLYILSLFFIIACNNETVSPDIDEENPIDETINNTPCDFDFTTINENDTLNIA
ncbi:MAG: hypothetical protein JEZ14_17560, partial [Marinilabiliaceae bacterium]|nr:hypothetical protein [Marinilabiliaceae bacterium]